jgi:hypothetical protein
MALTAPPRACGHWFQGHVSATAYATRSTRSRRNLSSSRHLSVRRLRTPFHTLWYRARRLKGLRVFALGQRLRHFVDHIAHTAGTANGERVQRWFQEKKTGWYTILEDPQMSVTSTLLDQAHHATNRQRFMMQGFHHPGGSQQAFLTGLAHLYNFISYQRLAQHAGQCGVEVEGRPVPIADWFLNLQILTSEAVLKPCVR